MFFWAKPADGNQWLEIPPTDGALMPGVYNIAVQSPQPHFTLVSHLRHYLRQEDGTRELVWQTEQSSRTNEEGVGWVMQNLELKEGWWQFDCRDADLVAELFGEPPQNCVSFQVAAAKSPLVETLSPPGASTAEAFPSSEAFPSEEVSSEAFPSEVVPSEALSSEALSSDSGWPLSEAARNPASLWYDTTRHAQIVSEPAIAEATEHLDRSPPSSSTPTPIQTSSVEMNGPETSEPQTATELHSDPGWPAPDPWGEMTSSLAEPSTDWTPDLQEDDLLPPNLAFASSRSPDRTMLRLLGFINAAATAKTTQQRYHLLNRRGADHREVIDGVVGEVIEVPHTQPLNDLASPKHLNRTVLDRDVTTTSNEPTPRPDESTIHHDVSAVLPDPAPTPQNPAPPAPINLLTLEIPKYLSSGDLVKVVMRLTTGFHPACIKLWVSDSVTDTIVDGPRWILDFTKDDRGRSGVTHFTIPSRVQTLQFKAMAYRDLPHLNQPTSEESAPVVTEIVERDVIPR